MKLFSKNSNVCEHNPRTLQTDRQLVYRDNFYYGNTALRYASHGKNGSLADSPNSIKRLYEQEFHVSAVSIIYLVVYIIYLFLFVVHLVLLIFV